LVFSTALASCGCGAASYSARRSTAACCCSNCSAQGGAPTPPPAPPARHSHGASCRFVPQAQPFRWRAPHSVRSVAQCLPARLQRTSYRRLHRRAALEHGDGTRAVSQACLESNHAVACQAFICSADLTSYPAFILTALIIDVRAATPIMPA